MRRPLLKLSVAAAVLGTCALAIWTTAGAVHRFEHVVDLTHTLSEDTPYIPIPGITFPFKKTTIATISRDGVAANRWEIHEHLGTQIDAPSHFIDQGLSIEQLPVASLVVPLVIIDVSTLTGQLCSFQSLEAPAFVAPEQALGGVEVDIRRGYLLDW